MESPENELRSSFFKNAKRQFHRCLAPGIRCSANAIRAHWLQNSQVLDLLVHDAHVKALTKKIHKDTGPQIFFDDAGRNRASTFAGACAEHDSSIFKPLDNHAFEARNVA